MTDKSRDNQVRELDGPPLYEELLQRHREIEPERFKLVRAATVAFGWGAVHDALEIRKALKYAQLTLDDAEEALSWIVKSAELAKKQRSVTEELFNKHFQCPECGTPLHIMPITTPEGKANLKGWHSARVCPNSQCLYHEYSKDKYRDYVKYILKTERELEVRNG